MQKQEKDRHRLEEHESLAGVIFSNLFSLLKIFLVCFVLVYLTANYLVRPLRVQGGSMYPTLKTGEFGFGNTFSGHFQEIKRGDIVIVYDKKKTHTYWVKRVIGLPGERIRASGDTVYINDTAIQEPYLDNDYADSIRLTENYKFTEDFDEGAAGRGRILSDGGQSLCKQGLPRNGGLQARGYQGSGIFSLCCRLIK